MNQNRARFLFLNLGHAYDHLFMLLFPTVVLSLEAEFQMPYAELLPLATAGFVCFGAGGYPFGWLGDRWSRKHMMTLFFVGIGGASVLTGLTDGPLGLAIGLTLIGIFASIYHPVGIAMVVQGVSNVGRRLGVNGVAGNLGVAAAALTAGALTDLYGWRAAFIVPGAVAIVTGLIFALVVQPPPPETAHKAKLHAGNGGARPLVRIFAVLAVSTVCGGLIFNGTLVSLPKVFDVRLSGFGASALGVSGLVSLVYVFGAFAQVLVGYLLDRHPLRTIMIGVAALQIPFLLVAANLANVPLLLVAGLMMFTIFGAIPITDTLVARNTSDRWRSRIYAIKTGGGLAVSAVAVPLISIIYGTTQEFVVLFALFAVLSCIIVVAGWVLPREGRPATVAPATSPAGS